MSEHTVFSPPELPEADPVPWLTEVWRKGGCFTTDLAAALTAMKQTADSASKEAVDEQTKRLAAYGWGQLDAEQAKELGKAAAETALRKAAFGDAAKALSAIVTEVGGTVASLHSDPNPYRVSFAKIATAGTDHAGRNVMIGTRLLLDDRPVMTEGRRAAGLTGIALHETGHIEDSQPYGEAVKKAFPGNVKAYTLHNVGDDNRIERRQLERYPALRAALECAAYFMNEVVMEQIAETGMVAPFRADLTTAEGRMKVLKMGVRYPHTVDWNGADEALGFIRGWADRMSADHTPKQHVALVQEALDWISDLPEAEEEPEPEPEESPEGDTESDDESTEGEGNDDPTEGEDESEGDDSDESESGEPNDGEAGDAEGDDEDGDGGEAEGDDESGDSDTEGEGDGEESESDGEGESDGEAEGEGAESESEGEGEGESEGSSETDAEGIDEGGDDAEGEGSDGEGTEGESESDPIGDTKGGSGSSDQPAEGDTEASGDVGSDEGTEGDLNEMPDIPDCQNEAAHDSENDSVADDLVQTHANARKDVSRMRRYPGATGGTVIVRETRFGGKAKVMAELDEFAALGEAVDESDANVKALVENQRDYSADMANGFATKDNPNAHSALAAVIVSSRTQNHAPEPFARNGRLNRSRLSRVATGETRVFVKNTAASPQKIRVHILIDASGSMGSGPNSNRAKAAQVGRDLAGALDKLPWATGRIYGFADTFEDNFVTRIWQTGQKRDAIDNFLYAPSGGTPLGYCMAYVCDDLLEEQKSGEKGVLIVVSDGEPSYSAGTQHVKNVTEYYRKRGIRVVSVAIEPLDKAQRAMFGNDYVTYTPNMTLFAKNLAKVIGSSL